MRSFCRAILALDVLYCLLAATVPGLPGWHMFESVERLEPALTDKDGVTVDLRALLPKGAYVLDAREMEEVARFACARAPERAPFVYEERVARTTFTLDARCALPDRKRARAR